MAIALANFDPFFRSHFGGGIDRLFEDILGDISYSVPTRARRKGPTTNVQETETGYEISVVAPGLKKVDFEITLKDGALCISHQKQTENTNVLSQNSFNYNWKAPKGTVGSDISAKYIAGILTVSVGKPAEEQAAVETIQVK